MNNPQKVFPLSFKKFKIFPHIPVICPSVVDVSKNRREKCGHLSSIETGELVILPNSSDCVDAFPVTPTVFGGLRRLYSPLFVKRPPSGSPDGGLFSDLFFFQGQRLFAEHGQKRLPLHGLMLQQIGTPRPPACRGCRSGSVRGGHRHPPPGAGPPGRSGRPPPRNSCGPGSWCGR